jgi:pyruvate,water dikinase
LNCKVLIAIRNSQFAIRMALLERIFRRRREPDSIETLHYRMEAFRSLVDRNNRVLELIADAGEKLGGEFIFDSQYLKTLTAQLHQEVRGVVYDLEMLTKNAYPDLAEAFQRIQAELGQILESRVTVPATDYVIPIDRVSEELTDAVGRKMARLGEIRNRLGCKVPDGFVVTASACQAYFESAGIMQILEEWSDSEVSNETQLKEKAQQLQSIIMSTPLPREVRRPFSSALLKLQRERNCPALALRSSATGEDGELSFAGLYATRLGVASEESEAALREVIASLFSPSAMMYRHSSGMHPARAIMAVGCQCLADARAAGVLYTLDPANPEGNAMIITATLGLGKPVVEGTVAGDRMVISRSSPHSFLSHSVVEKKEMLAYLPGRGLQSLETPEDQRLKPCLEPDEIAGLADTALKIERYMKCAQDIEWAVDGKGTILILQTRPLRITYSRRAESRAMNHLAAEHRVLMRSRGTVACRGIGAGPVVIVGDDFEPETMPQGAVLVARASSPRLSAAMPKAAAVITDLGTSTSHLATVAREFRVPMIVDTGDATRIFEGVAAATVDAEDSVIYEGIVSELLHDQLLTHSAYQEAREFRLLRRILNKVAPLSLSDPQASNFKASSCATYHDLIRFAHEKAVECLIEGSGLDASRAMGFARRLDLNVPLDLIVLDLGGGLRSAGSPAGPARMEDVASAPLRSLMEGLLTPGIWSRNPVEIDLDGFMASATRSEFSTMAAISKPEPNLAVVSGNYLHLNLKLGYHFNIVDCYLGSSSNDNFIYFRFAGGVTELTRRTRRAQLLAAILERFDFVTERRRDLVEGRIKKLAAPDMEDRLRMIGRLIGFTRQLDVSLRDDLSVEYCMNRFMTGNYST